LTWGRPRARSFSGDKAQLVPILKAALSHRGFALIDVISPCVTFNDHEGSTKSYLHTRKHLLKVVQADFVPPAQEITAQYEEGTTITVTLHDGSTVRLRKIAPDYDPSDRQRATELLEHHRQRGEIATGLLLSRSAPPTCTTSTARPRCRCVRSPTRSSAPARPTRQAPASLPPILPLSRSGRGPGRGRAARARLLVLRRGSGFAGSPKEPTMR
jgi:hypothetical protein